MSRLFLQRLRGMVARMQFWGMEDRIAEDIDVWIDTAEENATREYASLLAAGIRPNFQVDVLRQPNKQIRPSRTYLAIWI